VDQQNVFKWRHFQADIIVLCVRWYLRYALSYRDLEEMMGERGLCVDHTTIYRWVQEYAPELDRRCKLYLKATNASSQVDETYIKMKKTWMYLYRAVDSDGNTTLSIGPIMISLYGTYMPLYGSGTVSTLAKNVSFA
jgi:transposase-like protein